MAAAAVMSGGGLRPGTSQVEFTARPALRPTPPTKKQLVPLSNAYRKTSPGSQGSSSASSLVANPKLSVIEIEAMLREKVRAKYADLQQGFSNYDRDQSDSVTRGEFRRVIEAFCMALTTEQFDTVMNKVDTNPNGTVRYNEFLDKFYGKDRPKLSSSKSVDRWVNKNHQKVIRPTSPHEMNTDMTEKQVRDKIRSNMKNVIKALRLYDYNCDGHVQRHELRKVLENYCFKMSDTQFDKFYQRYDFHHRGVINYKDFLQRLGVNVDILGRPPQDNTAPGALNWQQQAQAPPAPTKAVLKQPDSSVIKGLSIEDIEMEFRERMMVNYANLKRMFMSLDKHMDGLIAIEDLISVLNHFTFAMSDQLFHQLMQRFGIKASGKISWEFFLEKFQDPQANCNGQTITIKPAHKFFPIRGAEETMDMGQIVRLLDNHVKNAYSSFKNAFLQFDKNRDGKITRNELKKIIEGFKFRLTDGQFGELFTLLDPQHTNFISYHKFLDLFEPKESIRGHKWLTSCHRFNDKQKPTILAWKTVEEILKDRIEDSWRDISKAVAACDTMATSKIFPSELRRILEKYCLPVSNEHFNSMMERIEDRDSDGRVNYVEFMLQLNVTIKPGDLTGLSSQIQDGSKHTELQHRDDQHVMQQMIQDRALDRTSGMTIEEVIVRIKDRMNQHNTGLAKAFRVYDRTSKGKISKKVFREVCESHGIYMSDPQFKELCGRLQFHNGHMKYMDFVTNFEDLRVGGPPGELSKINNHKVNPIRGDEYGLSAIEAESKLRNKLRENFEDLRGAFYKFDDNHSGQLSKSAFRRMLDSFMIRMSGEEFDKLCARLGVDSKSKLSYTAFLEKFEVRDTPDGHKWLNSDHRFNEIQPMGLMRAEDIHEVLCQKAHRQYKDLAKAFRSMDLSSTGVINKKDLREVLYKFLLPVSKQEFNRLWDWYDRGNKGFITHQDFLKRLSAEEFSPGDAQGASAAIIASSQTKLQEQHAEQQEKHEQITMHQAVKTGVMTVDTILQGLKDKIRENYNDFQQAFKLYDKKNKGFLSVADVQRVLVDFHYFLDDDQFFDLLDRLGLNTRGSKLSYEDFLKAFQEGRKDNYRAKPEDAKFPQHEFDHLSPDEAEQKARKRMAAQIDVIQAGLQAMDKGNSGYIDIRDFRRLVDNFCFKMTDKQFKYMRSKLTVNKDNSMDYTSFLEQFKDADPETDPRKWIATIQKRLDDDAPRELSMDEVHTNLRELMTARFYSVAQAFAEVDYAGIGVVAKDDFRNIVNKTLIRLSDEQFQRLWSTLRVNEFGNLEYQDFLDHYTSADPRRPGTAQPPATPMGGRRPATSDSFLGRRLHSSSGRPVTPLVNAESTEDRARGKINKHWKDIQRQCRSLDPNTAGHISQEDAKNVFKRYSLDLSYDDIFKLILKYDLHNNSRFCYPEFLKHFVLNLGQDGGSGRTSRMMEGGRTPSRMESGRLSRQKMTPSKLMGGGMAEFPASLAGAVDRVQQTVTAHWKDLRRDFRTADPGLSGQLQPDLFRDALRKNNVNLNEEEFSQMCAMYEGSGAGKVMYNDFIKDFLKTA